MRRLIGVAAWVGLAMLAPGAAWGDEVAVGTDSLVVEVAEDAPEEGAACEAAACDSEACEDAPCDGGGVAAEEGGDPDGGPSSDESGAFEPTHQQVALIPVNLKGVAKGSLHTFCLAPDGRVLAACSLDGAIDSSAEEPAADGEATEDVEGDAELELASLEMSEESSGPPTRGDVRVFSPEGELLDVWTLPFAPEAINLGSDGKVYVAGCGKLARYTMEGELVNEGVGPQVAPLMENREAVREEVIEDHKSSLEWMTEYAGDLQDQIEQIDETIARLEKEAAAAKGEEPEEEKEPATGPEAEAIGSFFRLLGGAAAGKAPRVRGFRSAEDSDLAQQKSLRDSLVEQKAMYEKMAEQQGDEELTEEEIESRVKASIAYKIQAASISEADGDVFLATGASKGHGFAVWRLSRHFDGATQIVNKLSGCCGQMDVQACEAGVFVAENSRKRVVAFDRNGESIESWGSDGEDVTGFGCCCNPMNLAFGKEGSVYTAESTSGRIKRYSTDGELLELVGAVDLVPGCKKVAIAVGPGGDRVYMLDQTRHHLVVMERQGVAEERTKTADEDEEEAGVGAVSAVTR